MSAVTCSTTCTRRVRIKRKGLTHGAVHQGRGGAQLHRLQCLNDLLGLPLCGVPVLLDMTQAGRPMAPGQVSKVDYEYERKGVANIYLCFDRHRGWRHTKVTKTKTATDFAELMRELVDVHYPDAERIRVVLDNLNTHRPASLYRAFPAPEARRVLRKLDFHYTPKHASWLNMVEIEIGNMNQQYLDRRIDSMDLLKSELAAWETRRNRERASINWMFDVDKARTRLDRAYDKLTGQN